MSIIRWLGGVASLVVLMAPGVSAQNAGANSGQGSENITLVTYPDRVRFVTPGLPIGWRLEITNALGQPVFDTGMMTGSAIDWALIDSNGQPVANGVYGFTVTVGSPAAQRVHRGQLRVERAQSVYQIQALNTDIPVAESPDRFNTGGEPAASAALPRNLGAVSFAGPVTPYSGTGTTGRIAKWLDGSNGVLGDTRIQEYLGSVLIGDGSYGGNLQIYGSEGSDIFAGMGPNIVTGPAFNFGYAGGSFGRSAGFFNVRPDAGAAPPNPSLRFMTGNIERMIITNTGNVGIGATNPSAVLTVKGPDTSVATNAFRVDDSTGTPLFLVTDNGYIYVGALASPSTFHVCYYGGYIRSCNSAAEYVPTVVGSHGDPETADLVSISGGTANPYGDDHAPFVTVKSSQPCDPNLLGYIVDPNSGADGKKVNDQYLPLAIYGYFPAKVTTANGAIRRGDAITSSAKPGYGMKATGSCRVIGYALEDAEKDGTIQVFANLSDHASPELNTLRSDVQRLTNQNDSLREQLARVEARLAALEGSTPSALPAKRSGTRSLRLTPVTMTPYER